MEIYLQFLCSYTTLLVTTLSSCCLSLRCCTADYLLALKPFHNLILMFHMYLRCHPIKCTDELHSQVWPGDYVHQVWTTGEVSQLPLPIRLVPKPSQTRPIQNAEQKPQLNLNSMENKATFMKSLVHNCQVDYSMHVIHVV